MKVLHLLSSTGYHGAENMAAELIHQMAALGVKNHLGILFGQKESNKDILFSVEPYIENGVVLDCQGKFDVSTVYSLRKYIKKNDIDIIHSHKYKTNLYSLFASFKTNVKLVSTCHNWLGSNFKMRFYARVDKNALRFFDFVVGVSEEVERELKRYVDPEKVIKIVNGIDIKKYHRVKEREEAKKIFGLEGKKVVGSVGRLSSDKGFTYLIDAIRKLADNEEDVYALIVGNGDYGEALKAYARDAGVSDRIVFTGVRFDTPLIYSALDVFVLPSLKEAFPLVVLEAMACGVPIVATRVGDVPRIVENNRSALLVEPKDVNSLFNSIRELLWNRELAEIFSRTAKEKVMAQYSSTITAKRYHEIYEGVLADKTLKLKKCI